MIDSKCINWRNRPLLDYDKEELVDIINQGIMDTKVGKKLRKRNNG